MAARARLALSGARPALAEADATGTRRVVDALVRDERLMGAAVCRRDGRTVAASLPSPSDYGCDQLPRRRSPPGRSGWDLRRRARQDRSTSRCCPSTRRGAATGCWCWSTT